ncbi:MarR family winged helix-turn-helix transcriptional regulator [Paucibacter sp. R3-3]|uniref:MarR family winged helix-turn-helix transcriptional regulator n=1 Tax=Roseateles agri TaxID=3098619 RepID=A0ABU5DQW6_9BURK|nr:MarR family winged helix-turn-helix transcriptional regulator [Paucibacter sp. R3-3]MDY0748715.1 MarR family winged helix-turn-helix transcriptional regulator [Paucibacter sp. R3-3]
MSPSSDLSFAEQRACALLAAVPGRSLSELAEAARIGLPAVSRMVERLAAAGLVRRDRSRADRRVICLNLAGRGAEVAHQFEAAVAEFEAKAFAGFSVAEASLLRTMLLRIEANASTPP